MAVTIADPSTLSVTSYEGGVTVPRSTQLNFGPLNLSDLYLGPLNCTLAYHRYVIIDMSYAEDRKCRKVYCREVTCLFTGNQLRGTALFVNKGIDDI
jgi:hypothetical protein